MTTARRVTSEDVARAAGVSRATVSYVLNDTPNSRIPEATVARVHAAARELGYRPSGAARALSRGRSDVVLAILPGHSISAVQVEVMGALAADFARQGLTFVPHFLTGDAAVDLDTVNVLCSALHPVAAFGAMPLAEPIRAALVEAGVGVIEAPDRVGSRIGPLSTDIDREIGRAQARTLLSRGCRSLAYLRDPDSPGRYFSDLRLEGVREAAAERGAMDVAVADVSLDRGSLEEAATRLRGAGVDGVAVFDDELALAFGDAARTLAPGIRYIGVDGSHLGEVVSPSLSTVVVRMSYARSVILEAVDAVVGGVQPVIGDEEFSVDVIERESTGIPRRRASAAH